MADTDPKPDQVLLVDDEPLVIDIIRRILKSAGYAVETAENGVQGLRLFAKGSWDVVITDRVMPEMGGEGLAAAIRKMAPKTPIILLSGTGGQAVPESLFDMVLAKPVTAHELLAGVARVLE